MGLDKIVYQISFSNVTPYFSVANEEIDSSNGTTLIGSISSSNVSDGLIIGLPVALIVVLCYAMYVFYKKLMQKKEFRVNTNSSGTGSTDQLQKDQDTTIDMGEYEGLYIPAFLLSTENQDFFLGKKIAQGGGGEIFHGTLVNSELIARNKYDNSCVVKKVIENLTIDSGAFLQEVSIMWLFRNERAFVKLLSYSENPKTIIMKNYPLGSLENYIYRREKNSELDKFQYSVAFALDMAKNIAIAINTMHEKGFCHNDLKPGNILLEMEDRLNVVLTDFGISTVLKSRAEIISTFNVKRIKGASISYAAPEVLKSLQSNTEIPEGSFVKNDIYAFGIILYELLGRRKPWINVSSREILKNVCRGLRPEFTNIPSLGLETYSLEKLIALIRSCWHQDPSNRPDLGNIIALLSSFKANI